MTSILDKAPVQVDDPIDEDKDYFNELVGEGKKYKDTQAVAKAIVHKDGHIKRVETENAELREQLQQARSTKRMEEMLDQLASLQKETTPSNVDTPSREPEKVNTLSEQDVEKILDRKEQLRQRQANADVVVDRLTKVYGASFPDHVATQARNLGMSVQQLDELAQMNPQAFFKLMDLPQGKEQARETAPPRSTSGFAPTATRKNWWYYEEMRKNDKKRYDTIAVQNEMMNEAIRQERSFYDK